MWFPGVETVTEVIQALQAIAPFNSLSPAVLSKLAQKLQQKTYPRDSYVFKQGQKSQNVLYLIVEGLAEVIVTNDKGIETVISYRRQYDFFGETVVLTQKPYPGSVRAKEDLTCLLLPGEEFERLIQNHLEFSGFFSQIVTERMRVLYEEIVTEQSYEAYSSVESPLFRKRVSELMSSPVVTCYRGDLISSVAQTMAKKNISAVIVVDEPGHPVGLITEKDLVGKVIARSMCPPESCTAEAVMNPDLVKVPANAFFNQALLAVVKHQVKHLAVMDQDHLVGIVTIGDLIKTRSTGTLRVTHDIESQRTLEGLAAAGREVDNVLNALVAEKASVPEIFEIVSEFHDRLTRRVILLCEAEMLKEGYGPPPVGYCWINMGSAGRKEQTLRTDQDNALIYADGQPGREKELEEYFHVLATKVVEALAQCGFAKCRGDVVASNPQWCKPLSRWQETVEHWIGHVEPMNIRMLTIFLDFRSVYGEKNLADMLWKSIFAAFKESMAVSHLLTHDDTKFRAPVSLLGGFVTEKTGPHKNELNLKASACVHIVNCVRIFAVKHKITETSTFGRLKELIRMRAIPQDDGEFIHAAYETLMMFRIRENLKKAKQGKEPDNYINPHHLSKREQALLRDAFSVISRLQKLTSNHFSIFWLNYLT